jgi:hypothetical protein
MSLTFDETAFITRNMVTGVNRDPAANLGTEPGSFGLGTSGQGMPSNPGSQRVKAASPPVKERRSQGRTRR